MVGLLSFRTLPAIDQSLTAPEVELTAAQDVWPPTFDIIIPTEIDVEITNIRVQAAVDIGFAGVVFDRTLTPVGEDPLNFDFSGIVSGEHYFAFWFEQGGRRGPSSRVWKHGDTTPPVITSADNSSAIEGVPVSGVVTANEAGCIIEASGADVGFYTLDAITGAWSLTETPDYYFGKRSYVAAFTATDPADNVSVPQAYTHAVTPDLAHRPAAQWSPRVEDKNANITLSGGNLIATVGPSAPGAITVKELTGRDAAATSRFAAAVTFSGGNTYFGFGYANAPTNAPPGRFDGTGICFHFAPGGWEFYKNGAIDAGDFNYGGGFVDGDVVTIERVGLTFRVKVNGAYVGSPHTIPAGSGDLFGFFSGEAYTACAADFTGY